MEYAVIETGGKQYRVAEGDVVTIEKLAGEHKEGGKIIFDKVLLYDDGKATKLGMPYIAKAKVTGTLQSVGRAKRIPVIRFKSKSRYFKKRGHSQPHMKVKIQSVK
jgi:large subunit ribosomal protein L21